MVYLIIEFINQLPAQLIPLSKGWFDAGHGVASFLAVVFGKAGVGGEDVLDRFGGLAGPGGLVEIFGTHVVHFEDAGGEVVESGVMVFLEIAHDMYQI